MHQLRAIAEPIRSISNFEDAPSFTLVGDPLAHPSRQLIFTNDTDATLGVSDDGENIKWVIQSAHSLVVNFTQNSHLPSGSLEMPQNTQLSVYPITAPSTGIFFVSSLYAQGD